MVRESSRLQPGDRVVLKAGHPWETHAGTLVKYERYGLGWMGWRVLLDGNGGECYANAEHLEHR